MTHYASPRWVASKVLLDSIPVEQRDAVVEELAFTYPTWFFEVLCEFDQKPLALEDFQIKYLLDNSTMKITNKTRQSGGSLQLAFAKFFKAFRTSGYKCDIVSINLTEATDKIRYIRNLWETLPERYRIPLTRDNALSIGFHKGNKQSIITSKAASAGVRGGRKDVVFDEFAHIPKSEELFKAAAPAIMNGDLKLDIVSTPLGNLNMFANIFNNRPNEEGNFPFAHFSRHEFIWCDVRRFVTDYDEVQRVWHHEMQRDMTQMRQLVQAFGTDRLKMFYNMYPWEIFKQEFCGVFLDEGLAFFPWSLIQKCLRGTVGKADDGETEYREVQMDIWYQRPSNNYNDVFMGIDFGESSKESDKTSIQILERDSSGRYYHRYSEVLKKEDYPDFPAQTEHMAQLVAKFRPEKVLCDETGLGRGIVPLLQRLTPTANVEGVNFNLKTKEEMVMNLKTLMESDKLWLQASDEMLHGQIRNIQREVTASGTAHRYHGEPHDDMFWALALAAYGGGTEKDFALYSIGGKRIGVR